MAGQEFLHRYEAVMAKWPVPYESRDLPTRFGTTHVNACGHGDGMPVVLVPGGRATSAAWYATVGALAGGRRVYAVDILWDAGRSVADGDPVKTVGDVVEWLAAVLDGLGIDGPFILGGHSMGGWIAGRFAIAAPHRVAGLVLLDPTDILSPTRLAFKLRGIVLFASRAADRFATFLRWETGGRPVDAAFAALWSGGYDGADNGSGSMSWFKVPPRAERSRLSMPVLVYVPLASRQNNPAKLIEAARALANATVVTIPDATHFTIPQDRPAEINAPLLAFIDGLAEPSQRTW